MSSIVLVPNHPYLLRFKGGASIVLPFPLRVLHFCCPSNQKSRNQSQYALYTLAKKTNKRASFSRSLPSLSLALWAQVVLLAQLFNCQTNWLWVHWCVCEWRRPVLQSAVQMDLKILIGVGSDSSKTRVFHTCI